MKYEFDKEKGKLVLDRVLAEPYYYPYAYGFIPNTRGNDGDDLDVVVITDKELQKDNVINGYIIGALEMEDEHGMDEKLFIVPEDEYIYLSDIDQIETRKLNKIIRFFSDYKKKDKDKWSKVHGLLSKSEAYELYKKCKL